MAWSLTPPATSRLAVLSQGPLDQVTALLLWASLAAGEGAWGQAPGG